MFGDVSNLLPISADYSLKSQIGIGKNWVAPPPPPPPWAKRDERILDIVNSYDGFNLLSYLRRVATYTSELILFMFVNRRVFHSWAFCILQYIYKQIGSFENLSLAGSRSIDLTYI